MQLWKASRGCVIACLLLVSTWVGAFQIGPLGTKHEERLTNETNSTLARIAGSLGVLIKTPVHEEITHLGKWCHVQQADLATDTYCSGRDVGFSSPYVIYGVRWNDLPPFRLEQGQGNCDYMGKKNVCDQVFDPASLLVLPFQGCRASGTDQDHRGLQQNGEQRSRKLDDAVTLW